MKTIKLLAILITIGAFVGLLLNSAFAIYKEEGGTVIEPSLEDQYRPDVVIVKFKEDVDESALLGGPLEGLTNNYSVESVQPVFKALHEKMATTGKTEQELANEIKTRFLQRAQRAAGGKSFGDPGLRKIYKINLQEGSDVNEAIATLKQSPDIEWAEPDYIVKIQFTPDDPLYYQQYAHQLLESEYAWDTETGDNAIKIAVIDTGIDYNHPDLAANMWVNEQGTPGYDFYNDDDDPMDDEGHGTMVAGIIAAVGNNGQGVAGLTWDCQLMALKACSSSGACHTSELAAAIYYAIDNGADIINASWGSHSPSNLIGGAIWYTNYYGLLVVAGAGNDNSSSPFYPAAYAGVISVAATNTLDQKASYSNYGPWIDLSAPGNSIRTTRKNGGYTVGYGTSFSTPHVSGVAALLLSNDPTRGIFYIRRSLVSGTDNIDHLNPDYEEQLGTGRINARYALEGTMNHYLVVEEFTIDDSDGDSDGQVDPGETIDLEITLGNRAFNAPGVEAILTTQDPHVTIIDEYSYYGEILYHQTSTNTSDPFKLKIDLCTPTVTPITLSLMISAEDGYEKIASISFVVLVDNIPITTEPGYQVRPAIYEDKIVWIDNGDIYLYNISTEEKTQIVANTANHPAIYDDKIVWADNRNGNLDIYLYNLSTGQEAQITTEQGHQMNPAIYDDKIVWADKRDGNWDIYLFDLSTGEEIPITTDPGYQSYPTIYGDKILWQGNGIYLYDLSTGEEMQISSTASGVAIFEDKIVYQDNKNGNWDIYLFDLPTGEETQITTNASNQSSPALYGNWIVWHDERNENWDIYIYDLSTGEERQITMKTVDQMSPVIYGDKVVWEEGSTGYPHWNIDIYMVDLRANRSPLLDPIGDKTVRPGQTLEFAVSGADCESDSLAYSAVDLPIGATFDPETQMFQWTAPLINPPEPYDVTFTVTDPEGASDSETITITVEESTCFLAGTPILLADQTLKSIEDIKVGDIVLAFDEESGELKKDKVTQVFHHLTDKYLVINDYLKVTSEHPVYANGQWIEIGRLEVGDMLLNKQGNLEPITSIEVFKEKVDVYNIEVNPYHTYIAGGIVVHNKALSQPKPKGGLGGL